MLRSGPVRSPRLLVLYAGLIALLCSIPNSAVAQPTTDTDPHTPRGAAWRSAVLPGWGQVYNGQIYKVPIVYAGLAGLAGGAVYYSREHRLWDRAFRFRRAEELIESGVLEMNPCPSCQDEYLRLLEEEGVAGDIAASQLRPVRDNLRRNRDLFIVGVGLWHGLVVLDAYVSAHLLDFDVGDDLTVSLRPQQTGIAATLRFR